MLFYIFCVSTCNKENPKNEFFYIFFWLKRLQFIFTCCQLTQILHYLKFPSSFSFLESLYHHSSFIGFLQSLRYSASTHIYVQIAEKTFAIIENKNLNGSEQETWHLHILSGELESRNDATMKQTTPSSAPSGTVLHFIERNQSFSGKVKLFWVSRCHKFVADCAEKFVVKCQKLAQFIDLMRNEKVFSLIETLRWTAELTSRAAPQNVVQGSTLPAVCYRLGVVKLDGHDDTMKTEKGGKWKKTS